MHFPVFPLVFRSSARRTRSDQGPGISGPQFDLTPKAHIELAETERLVNQLNGWEWCALESPPFVGAWTCLPEKGEPVFMTFVADEAWHPQLVGSLVDWALRRAEVAQRWVVNGWE